uniref:Uncharacterized protein n=1 Tax=Anguilla anguilla TaxID=7936 RepID=A0A0E9S3Y8_ANGAN
MVCVLLEMLFTFTLWISVDMSHRK